MRHPSRALLAAAALLWTAGAPVVVHAQIEDNLSAYTGPNAQGYLEPLRGTLSSGLGAGLYTSASIPKTGVYFRVDLRAMVIRLGDDDRFFPAVTEDYYPGTVTTTQSPTVVGPTDAVTVTDGGTGTSFTFPGGLDLEQLPLAAPQLTVGGIAGSELMLRFFAAEFGDNELGDISLFAIGARHSISQYFPTLPFAVSGMLAYQKFSLGDDFVDFSMLSFGVQASKPFRFVEPYAGLSLDRSSMDLEYTSSLGGTGTQPVSVEFESQSDARLTLGAALRLAVVHLNGEVNVGDRTTFVLGLSFGN
jgi:hypothetical protein